MSDKRKRAVALKYDRNDPKKAMGAPAVVAKGAGEIAKRIIEKAQEHDVYIHEDEDLVEILGKLELGAEIPPELYEAVAKVLSVVYKMNKDYKS